MCSGGACPPAGGPGAGEGGRKNSPPRGGAHHWGGGCGRAWGRGRRGPRCCPPSPRSWTSAPRRPSTSTGPKTSSGLEPSSRGVASGLAAEVPHQAVDRRRVVGNLDLGSELLAPDLRVGE